MHEFCLEATHKVLRYTSDEEEDLLRGVFAIRKVDEVLVMLRILDFRQLPQTRRTVMTARVKANLRYPSRYLTQIYSLQEAPDKSRILIELYLSTNKTFECLLVEDVISVERAVRLISDLVHGTVELLDYYLQRNVTVTQDLLCNAILLPSTLFILHDDTILFPNPCIATLDADLGFLIGCLSKSNGKDMHHQKYIFAVRPWHRAIYRHSGESPYMVCWYVSVGPLFSRRGSDGIADAMVDTVFLTDALCIVMFFVLFERYSALA